MFSLLFVGGKAMANKMKKFLCCVLIMCMLSVPFAGAALAKEQGDYNIGYEAEVTVRDDAGLEVSAGHNGENIWRTNVKSINDYFVDYEANYWGTSYTTTALVLPINVDFDYGAKPAEVGQITFAEARRSTAKPEQTGTYTKVRLEYFDGNAWQVITPAVSDGSAYTVNEDKSISLNWATPTRTESLLNSVPLMLIDVALSERCVSDKIRVKILEADATNGDCWGEFGIDEILMYGQPASESACAAVGEDFLGALAEKVVANAEKLATAEQLSAAREAVNRMTDSPQKTELLSRLNVFSGKEWKNFASEATVTAGVNPIGATMLNDDNLVGTVPLCWEIPGTVLDENAWFQYDYGKEVTIKRIDLGSRYVNNSFTKIEVYSVLKGEEALVGTYDLKFGKVPEQIAYNAAADFSFEAFEAFDRNGQVYNDEVHYSDFCSIVFDSSFLCDGLKIKVLEKREPAFTAMCTEVRTYGVAGADVTHHYTETNQAFNHPVFIYDQEGNALELSNAGGAHKMGIDALNDYSIGSDGWYEAALPHDKLPFYLEVDYQGTLTELSSIALGIGPTRSGGLISRMQMQVFDGAEWVAVQPSQSQSGGVAIDGTDVILDWNEPSSVETDETKSYRFMTVQPQKPVLCYKFRILVKEATSDNGIIHLDELLTYGVNPVWADLDERENGAELRRKHSRYTIDRAFEEPTQSNVTAAMAEIEYMEDAEQKMLTCAALERVGVWDIISNASGSAGMGSNPGGLTDGLAGFPTERWISDTNEFSNKSWVQLDFTEPSQVSRLRIAARYFPTSLKTVDIYAKVGTELVLLEKDVQLHFSHSPELIWYGKTLKFDNEARQAYMDNDLMRNDSLEFTRSSWVEIPLPKTVTCNGIRVQILDAQLSWGSYEVAEMQAVGRTGGDGDVFAVRQGLFTTDGTAAASLADLKAQGGYFSASIGNPSEAQKQAAMFVMYYKGGEMVGSDAVSVDIAAKSTISDKKLNLTFDDKKAECDMIKCFIWSNLNNAENAKGTGLWLELE